MEEKEALLIANKIIKRVFGREVKWGLDEIREKFAADLKLSELVPDFLDGRNTFADVPIGSAEVTEKEFAQEAQSYISQENLAKIDAEKGFMLEKRPLNKLEDIFAAWHEVNSLAAERKMDTIGVSHSDTIYGCENVYQSRNCFHCKNIVFCDSMDKSEFDLASARSTTSNFCIRVNDSQACSNSYQVVYCNKIISSLFIQDAFDLYECMFCAHIASKKYCICNMQFDEKGYFELKDKIIDWILQ